LVKDSLNIAVRPTEISANDEHLVGAKP
jgi:hypothetical protein